MPCYLQQLIYEAQSGIAEFCKSSVAAGQIEVAEIEAAVLAEVEIRGVGDFGRVSVATQALLKRCQKSVDSDLAHVVAKILKSVRLAAYTHVIGEDAQYVDRPLLENDALT